MDKLLVNLGRLIATIKRLPAVLQNEIWEYVHGDRHFWRSKFEKALDHLEEAFYYSSFRSLGCNLPIIKTRVEDAKKEYRNIDIRMFRKATKCYEYVDARHEFDDFFGKYARWKTPSWNGPSVRWPN